MKLYNTLTKNRETVKPLREGQVSIYSCGPTVYDELQIGNWRAMIVSDLLRRVVVLNGFTPDHVMNITDVDDKTIKKTLDQGKTDDLKAALLAYTKNQTKQFLEESFMVGNNMLAVRLKHATDQKSIEAMQKLIRRIVSGGYGYERDGSIYFDIAAYTKAGNTYGVLSNVDFKPQARIDNDEYDKQQARDFVLWKAATEGEVSWPFDLNGKSVPGRPGWHIECSAMAVDEHRDQVDIHTGGIDLIFPHHENEIAQTRAGHHKDLAKMFVHNNHLLIDGQKMSKSKGNDYKLSHIVKDKGFDPLALRVLMLQAHYRSELNFTWESMQAAANYLQNLRAWADLRHQNIPQTTNKEGDVIRDAMLLALNDDLDTPKAMATLSKAISPTTAPSLKLVVWLDEALGLKLATRPDLTDEQKAKLAERQEARNKGDYATSDKMRDELRAEGIEFEDTAGSTIWRRAKA